MADSQRRPSDTMSYIRTSVTLPVLPVPVSAVTSGFIQSADTKHMDCPNRWINSMTIQSLLVLVVLTDFVVGCIDTDMRAAGRQTPAHITILLRICLAVYIAEFCLLVAALKRRVFQNGWAILDFTVCITGVIELIPEATGDVVGSLGNMKLLRLLRVVRMLKLLRRIAHVKELKRLLQMATNCVRALSWSIVFCFMVLTIWSLVSVEVLHPIITQLAEEGHWPDCPHCADAFSSVMVSNLTLFQTIMASDEFGIIAVPVIKRYPATAIIFMGSFITISYGVLNLVVALVVDTFAEQRQQDDKLLAEDLDEAAEEDLHFLGNIFNEINEDGSGQLSLDEMQLGARTNKEFRSRLRVLDLDAADLEQLFYMLDADSSGTVDKDEFINTLNRWKEDSRTAARFVKHNMRQALDQQERILAMQKMQYEYLVATAGSRPYSSEALEKIQEDPIRLEGITLKGNRRLTQPVSAQNEGYQQEITQEGLEKNEFEDSVDAMENESTSEQVANVLALGFRELLDGSIGNMRVQLERSIDNFEVHLNNIITERLGPVYI